MQFIPPFLALCLWSCSHPPVIFRIYDINNDNFIVKEELSTVLKVMVSKYISEEDIAAIVEQTFKEGDSDSDGKLSFEDFRKIILHTDIGQRLTIGF
jgi:serine/threonine-protein phosphatase 2B regulatory subunit